MTYYAIIDTNVIVSSFLKKQSIPFQVVQLSLKGPIIPIINNEILYEYKDVLLRSKFHFPIESILEFLKELSKRAIYIDKVKTNEVFKDPDDIVFYEVTLSARNHADAYLVTGNIKDFPKKSFIVTPKEMLEIIEKDRK